MHAGLRRTGTGRAMPRGRGPAVTDQARTSGRGRTAVGGTAADLRSGTRSGSRADGRGHMPGAAFRRASSGGLKGMANRCLPRASTTGPTAACPGASTTGRTSGAYSGHRAGSASVPCGTWPPTPTAPRRPRPLTPTASRPIRSGWAESLVGARRTLGSRLAADPEVRTPHRPGSEGLRLQVVRRVDPETARRPALDLQHVSAGNQRLDATPDAPRVALGPARHEGRGELPQKQGKAVE